MKKLARLRATVDGWTEFHSRVLTIIDLIELASATQDPSLDGEIVFEANALLSEFKNREFELVLSGEYDDHSAILAIHAGAGGTESQDWAEILLRMYTRWGDSTGYKTQILDLSEGEEAGIKSVTIEILGLNAYGYVKSESGVHRLVRLSPFDSSHARHTSFALVEVLPEIDNDLEVHISADDIEMDVFRASGAGGQNVQKNSTAVRIRHIPSGLVVSCQNERSQLQNREAALKILRSRLVEMELKRQEQERASLKGEHVSAGWGNQIRSYVLHPYKLVKDHRTGFESTNPESILDGEIQELIQEYLLVSVNRSE